METSLLRRFRQARHQVHIVRLHTHTHTHTHTLDMRTLRHGALPLIELAELHSACTRNDHRGASANSQSGPQRANGILQKPPLTPTVCFLGERRWSSVPSGQTLPVKGRETVVESKQTPDFGNETEAETKRDSERERKREIEKRGNVPSLHRD